MPKIIISAGVLLLMALIRRNCLKSEEVKKQTADARIISAKKEAVRRGWKVYG